METCINLNTNCDQIIATDDAVVGGFSRYTASIWTILDFNYVMDTVNGFIEIAWPENTIGEEINIATQQ